MLELVNMFYSNLLDVGRSPNANAIAVENKFVENSKVKSLYAHKQLA